MKKKHEKSSDDEFMELLDSREGEFRAANSEFVEMFARWIETLGPTGTLFLMSDCLARITASALISSKNPKSSYNDLIEKSCKNLQKSTQTHVARILKDMAEETKKGKNNANKRTGGRSARNGKTKGMVGRRAKGA